MNDSKQPWGVALEDSKPHPTIPGSHVVPVQIGFQPMDELSETIIGRRHLKCVSVTKDLLMHVLTLQNHWECLQLPVGLGIPEDASVRDVQWNWSRYCFDVLISHRSFAAVPEGQEIPRIDGCFVEMAMFHRRKVEYERVT